MNSVQQSIDAYQKHRNLKIAASEIGIPWQTLYVHLRKAGVPVTGDKLRYGSDADRLAAKSEQLFLSLVPAATDMNQIKFQSKVDFMVNGYSVDVKASTKRLSSKRCKLSRWAFSIKKQEVLADFFVCFGFDNGDLAITLLIPGEVARMMTSISCSESGGKWFDYAVDHRQLSEFFSNLPSKVVAQGFRR